MTAPSSSVQLRVPKAVSGPMCGVLLTLMGTSLACGLREPWDESKDGDAANDGLIGIHALAGSDFPQHHQLVVEAGTGFVALGPELAPGMPLRVEVRALAKGSAWGEAGTMAGPGAPAPLRARGAVLLRMGQGLVVAGSRAVVRAAERVQPEIAVNVATADPQSRFAVDLWWGEPTRSYDPQLHPMGLPLGEGQMRTALAGRDGMTQGQVSIEPGARVCVRPVDATLPEDLNLESLPFPRMRPGAWMASTPDGQARFLSGMQIWSVGAGGSLRVQGNLPPGVSTSLPQIEVFEPLGTREGLVPIQAMDRVHRVDLQEEPRKMIETKIFVKAGDLVRVELRGRNHLEALRGQPIHNLGVLGGWRRVPLALRNGDRGWLVPGARARAVFVKVGAQLVELVGSDAFYAQEAGELEIGLNQCFDGGDWPEYVACRRRLENWEVDLRVVVGVSGSS